MRATNGRPPARDIDALDGLLARSPGSTRTVDAEDWRRYEGYLREILGAFGLDLSTPGTVDTPRRFLRALYDGTDGYDGNPKLPTAFPTESHGGANCELSQVIEGPIPFAALCEHHALPFVGRAWVAYVAHDRIIGISKLTRLVRVLTRRFGVRERMTHQIADSLESMLGAHGTAVYLGRKAIAVEASSRHGETIQPIARSDPPVAAQIQTGTPAMTAGPTAAEAADVNLCGLPVPDCASPGDERGGHIGARTRRSRSAASETRQLVWCPRFRVPVERMGSR